MYETDGLPVTIYFYPLLSNIKAQNHEIERYMNELCVLPKKMNLYYMCIFHTA